MGKNLNEYNNMSLQKTDAVPGERHPKFTFFIPFCAGCCTARGSCDKLTKQRRRWSAERWNCVLLTNSTTASRRFTLNKLFTIFPSAPAQCVRNLFIFVMTLHKQHATCARVCVSKSMECADTQQVFAEYPYAGVSLVLKLLWAQRNRQTHIYGILRTQKKKRKYIIGRTLMLFIHGERKQHIFCFSLLCL